ncbi:hypothetical protein [Jejuia pallidilutea]|nr:hypothetical protein [Jejuia pallidilutea]
MKKIIMIAIMFLCVLTSCKNRENKTPEDNVETKEVLSVDKFTVVLRGIITKDDNFQVFYTEYEGDVHTEAKSVVAKVFPSDDEQDITFELPKKVYPMNLRIDLGNNIKQESITINELIFKYKKGDYRINSKELNKYFTFNKGIEMLSDSITFKLKPISYQGIEKHDPYMVGNKSFIDMLTVEL